MDQVSFYVLMTLRIMTIFLTGLNPFMNQVSFYRSSLWPPAGKVWRPRKRELAVIIMHRAAQRAGMIIYPPEIIP